MEHEERGLDLRGFGTSLKQVSAVLGIIFAVVLAVVVGKQMNTEAMAVVVGVVCGVAAGIPTSLLLFLVLSRREQQRSEGPERRARQGAYPPVVVIQGGGSPGLAPGPQAGYWPMATQGPQVNRQFQVVGGDDLLMEDGRY